MENKSCRQETAVRTVAQTLGGIAVFRSELQYLYLYLYLYFQVGTSVFEFNIVEIQLQSLTIVFPQGDPGSVVSRNCRDTCWPLSLRCLQCNVTNSKTSTLSLTNLQVCSADLTVPVLHGAIIEGVATLICRLGSRLVALKEPQYDFDNYMVMVFKD